MSNITRTRSASPIPPAHVDQAPQPLAPSNTSPRHPVASLLEGLQDIKRMPREVLKGIVAHTDVETLQSIRLGGNDQLGLTLKEVAEEAIQADGSGERWSSIANRMGITGDLRRDLSRLQPGVRAGVRDEIVRFKETLAAKLALLRET